MAPPKFDPNATYAVPAFDPGGEFQAQATPAAPQAPQEGFAHSLGAQFGAPETTPTVGQALTQGVKNAVVGPAGMAASALYQQGKQSFDQLRQAYQAAKEGNTAGVGQHLITAVPIVGPALDKGADQYADKNYTGEAGTLLGASAQAAPLVAGGIEAAGNGSPGITPASVMDKIPTRGKAGAIFNDLNTKLADQPVPLQNAAAPLQRAIEVAVRGGTMPGPVKALLDRSQMTEPMTFPEARDYQASLSDLSSSDKMAMNGRMRGAVAQLSQALYQDLRTAAESGGGMGGDYDKAMTQYRQASRINELMKASLKYGGKAALGAAGAGGAYEIGKAITDK